MLVKLTVKSCESRHRFTIDHCRIIMIQCLSDFILILQCSIIFGTDDHLRIRHGIRLIRRCQSCDHIHNTNLSLCKEMLYILLCRKSIHRHIHDCDIFQISICISVCLTIFVFRTLDQSFYRLSKCYSVILNGKSITHMKIPPLGKCIGNPDTIFIRRIKLLT